MECLYKELKEIREQTQRRKEKVNSSELEKKVLELSD